MKTINSLTEDFREALVFGLKELEFPITNYPSLKIELNDMRKDKFVNKITCRILTPAYYQFANYNASIILVATSMELQSLIK